MKHSTSGHSRYVAYGIIRPAAAATSTLLALLVIGCHPPGPGPLVAHCAAGVRGPADAAARDFQQSTGTAVELRYGASETLVSAVRLTRAGDLLIPADDSYVADARRDGLVAAEVPLARMTAVAAVPRGNPKRLAAFADLLRPGLRLAQANPDAAAVGKLTRDALAATGRWAELEKRTTVFTGTVVEAANAVRLGSADAAVCWDAVVAQNDALEAVRVPELEPVVGRIAAAVLTTSRRPADARALADWLAGPGRRHFAERGFADP